MKRETWVQRSQVEAILVAGASRRHMRDVETLPFTASAHTLLPHYAAMVR